MCIRDSRITDIEQGVPHKRVYVCTCQNHITVIVCYETDGISDKKISFAE